MTELNELRARAIAGDQDAFFRYAAILLAEKDEKN